MLYNTSKKGLDREENLANTLFKLYFPYWPIFVVVLIVSLAIAWGYMQYKTPIYEITATMMIKDENKGVDDSKMVQSMNPFDSKKIVENEIKVLQSRDLMKVVVDKLNLYAPIFEESELAGIPIKSVSAYNWSPISVVIKNPENIVVKKGAPTKHYFTFASSKNSVNVDGKTYPLNQWVESPFGTVMFLPNKKSISKTGKPLYFTLSNPRGITQGLLKSLEITPPEKLSTVVNLSFKDAVPERGEEILEKLIETYRQKGIEAKNVLAAHTMEFIEERIENVENELDDLESEIEQYRSSKGVVNLSEQGRLYLQDAGEVDRRITETRLKLSILDKVENYIESKNMGGSIVPSTLGIDDPVLTQLLQKLYDSEIKYEGLKNTTAVNNPMLTSIADEIEKIRPTILDNIRSQRSNLQTSLANMTNTSGKYDSALRTLPEKERKLLEITRRKEVKNDLFAYLLKKREETALTYVPTDGDSKIVTRAQASLEPVSPKGFKVYGIAFFLAVGFCVAYVVIKDMMNKTVLFRSEIDDIVDLPVLGELSYIKNGKTNSPSPTRDIILTEQLRKIAAKLGLYSRTFTKQKILITSSIAGEGKSFLSINLAFSLSQSGKRVALLDMDFRKPQLSQQFNLADKMGIVQYLKGIASLEEITNLSIQEGNFTVLPSGGKRGDQTQLLLNGMLEPLFEQLSKDYDYIIIDSAPLGLVSETNLLAEFSDINLLVIRHGVTPKDIIQRLGQNEKSEILEKMCVVFNGVKKRGFVKETSGYGYGYSQIYGYGV
ncbi:AAA family ATPase [Flavobacteriaceae bacterium F89]|uniref:non-specific protein-tyrosine kinase n=1 Tax=Cerina litoralis TaxID=2874477 RepID=A0AAE3EU59_9FLAO|nr:AAA family ATPase [Cerina litoralis]MCG2459681.1 AAA family ATPase [Cerina litoralis]